MKRPSPTLLAILTAWLWLSAAATEARGQVLTNVALSTNGAQAFATSTANPSYPPAAAIDGDRTGAAWGPGAGGWNDGSQGVFSSDAVVINFNQARAINQVDVITLRDNFATNPNEPDLNETFNTAPNTGQGVVDYDVQYLSGHGWVTVTCGNTSSPCGRVVGNNKVWRRFSFSAVSTTAIRIAVHKGAVWTAIPNNYSRLVEVEAWGPDPVSGAQVNMARAAGTTVEASSQVNANYPVAAVVDGERAGRNWGHGGLGSGWNDATEGVFSADALQVNFKDFAPRPITEIDVFTLRDGFSTKNTDPTLDETFNTAPNTGSGVRYFEVQYWDGARWQTVPGGLVTNNDKVWTRLQFPAVTTAAVRVVVRDGALWTSIPNNYSRVVELEAWSAAAPGTGAQEVGQWGPQELLDTVPVHASLLPDGRLLYWGRDKAADGWDINDRTQTYLWNPTTKGKLSVLNATTNLFCSSHSFMADGRLLVAGGHTRLDAFPNVEAIGEVDLNIFDYRTNQWTRHPAPMQKGRWYPSSVTLANGDTVFLSGTYWDGTYDAQGIPRRFQNRLPEVFTAAGQLRQLTNSSEGLFNYPFLHAAPNGLAVWAGPGPVATKYFDPYYVDENQQGRFTNITYESQIPSFFEGVSVLYDAAQGIIINAGGRSSFGLPVDNAVKIINLSNVGGGWAHLQPLAFRRKFHSATLLPNGRVLVTGGTQCPGSNDLACAEGAATRPELYDLASNSWRTLAENPSRTPRAYHSIGMLLPDGRVLVGGGGLPAAGGEVANGETCVDGQASNSFNCRTFGHKDVEIFSPPYLFAPNGQPATRPVISSAPAAVSYGQTFFVATSAPAEISSVVLVRLPSITHGVTFDQRRVVLNFQTAGAGLNVNAPASGNLCPPGHYMMFIMNSAGTPSRAKIIQVT